MIWQVSAIALYLLGGAVSLRVIYFADENVSIKSNNYEKIGYCFFWPILTVGCILIVSHEWFKDRK